MVPAFGSYCLQTWTGDDHRLIARDWNTPAAATASTRAPSRVLHGDGSTITEHVVFCTSRVCGDESPGRWTRRLHSAGDLVEREGSVEAAQGVSAAGLLARAILRGGHTEHETTHALAEYERTRDLVSQRLFDITERVASLRWDLEEISQLLTDLSDAMTLETDLLTGFSTPTSHEAVA